MDRYIAYRHFAEWRCPHLEKITKVTENVTLNGFCHFIFSKNFVNVITGPEKYSTEGNVLNMANRINLNGTSYHGAGAIAEITKEVKARTFQKAFVCSDPNLIKFHVTSQVTDVLDREGLAYEIYSDIKANPTIQNVQNGVTAFKKSGADYIIAIGGDSSMDTAKAIGIIIANPEFEDVRSLEGTAPTRKPSVPIIAVPTTAGTAAEVTINYVITDVERKRKFVCVDPHDMPVVAVVDPEIMSSMPKGLTAATGMDALTHAIEGYTTKAAWEMTDMFHLKAIKIISKNLRGAVASTSRAWASPTWAWGSRIPWHIPWALSMIRPMASRAL